MVITRDQSCETSLVSSIRIFVLGSLAERGPMHGHALRLLAEEEHVDEWADVAASAIYGVMKRLETEDLIRVLRTEREGNYPERQVFGITEAGTSSLNDMRHTALETLVMKPDPVDLALARLDADSLDTLPDVIEARLVGLHTTLENSIIHLGKIAHHLTLTEHHIMRHQHARLRGEIAWHEELITAMPEILDDEKSRKGLPA